VVYAVPIVNIIFNRKTAAAFARRRGNTNSYTAGVKNFRPTGREKLITYLYYYTDNGGQVCYIEVIYDLSLDNSGILVYL